MGKHWIRYREAGSGNIIHTHAEFTDIELKVLSSFAEYAHYLGLSSYFKEEKTLKLKITWTEEDGFESESDVPDDDLISSFLHRLRPFILQEEKTYFHKICKILSRRLDNVAIRNKIAEQKKIFDGERIRSMVVISSNEKIINSEGHLRKWLNAYEYHRDTDKQKELEELHWLLPHDTYRALFLQMLCEKSDTIFYIQWLIKALREGNDCGDGSCQQAARLGKNPAR